MRYTFVPSETIMVNGVKKIRGAREAAKKAYNTIENKYKTIFKPKKVIIQYIDDDGILKIYKP